MIRFRILAFGVSLLLAGVPANPLHAEETRAEEISKKKAEKAKKLKPYTPNKAELILRKVEKALTTQPDGWYPFFGSIYTGGLVAAGPGYRYHLGDTGLFDIHGAWSLENYRMVDTSVVLPQLAAGKFNAKIYSLYINAGKVPFYGLGNDSRKEDKTRFGYHPTSFGLQASYNPVRFVNAGAGIEYLKVDTRGPDQTIDNTPGMKTDPLYTVTSVRAALDWRLSPGYTTSGGLYRVEWRDYSQHGDNDLFGFRSFEAEINQFFPIRRANQVIALQALTTITDAKPDSLVPYYMMPRLGGSHYLRGFPSSRFRDLNRLLLAAEYRWTPSRFLDVALFYETGKVAADTADLNLTDLHDNIGIGFRFHSPSFTVIRIELAHSSETTRLIFTIGPAF